MGLLLERGDVVEEQVQVRWQWATQPDAKGEPRIAVGLTALLCLPLSFCRACRWTINTQSLLYSIPIC
jgi:hypothetical protein